MKIDEVPQDQSKSYDGNTKVIYAADEQGHYRAVSSSGWAVEAYATEMAIAALAAELSRARDQLARGEVSPIAVLMVEKRYDLAALAQTTGFWQWQIRRHCRPAVFNRLSPRQLQRYADAFNLSAEAIRALAGSQP